MHHDLDPVLAQRLRHRPPVAERSLDQLTPLHRAAMTGRKIIENNHMVAGFGQPLAHVRADVAGAAHYEHIH